MMTGGITEGPESSAKMGIIRKTIQKKVIKKEVGIRFIKIFGLTRLLHTESS
jgi:hypothetical protein